MKKNDRKHFAIVIMLTLIFVMAIAVAGASAATVPYGSGKVKSADGAYIRSSSSTSSKIVACLPNNTDLIIKKIVFKKKSSTAAKNKWYQVSANGVSGYIRSDLVKGQTYTGVKAKVTGKVNYRAGAGTKMKNKGFFKKGAEVTVYLAATPVSSTKGSSKTWYMIKKGTKKYYASSKYFKLIDTEPANVVTASTPVEIAATPDPTPQVVGELGNGSLNNGVVDQRIAQLCELCGTYFTTDGRPCEDNGSEACNVVNVIKSNGTVRSLLKKYKGGDSFNASYLPYHYNPYGSSMMKGYSCCGFANFAGWFIAADGIGSNTHFDRIYPSLNYDYANMSKCVKAGDILRSKTHSFMVISIDSDGCNVIDSNWGNSCQVTRHKIAWGQYDVVTVCRGENRS